MISRSTSHCLWCLISHLNQGSCLDVNAFSQSTAICYKMQIFSVALLLFTIFQDVEPDKFRNPRHFSFFKTDKKMLAKNSFNTKSDGSESPNGFESFKTSSKSKSSSLPFLTGVDDSRVGKMRDNEIWEGGWHKTHPKHFDLDRTCVCSCHVSPSDQEFNLQSRKGPSPGLGGNNNVESSNVRPSSRNYATTAPRRHARQPKVRSSLIQYSIAAQTNKRKKVFNK